MIGWSQYHILPSISGAQEFGLYLHYRHPLSVLTILVIQLLTQVKLTLRDIFAGSGNTRYVAMSGTSAQYNTNNISGTFTFTQQTNIRTAPSTSASIVGVYYPGDSVIYNAQITADGYTWLQYISGSGTLRYAVM